MLKTFKFCKQTAPRKNKWLKIWFRDLFIGTTDVTGVELALAFRSAHFRSAG